MQRRTIVRSKTNDVTGIGRNLGLEQSYMQHKINKGSLEGGLF